MNKYTLRKNFIQNLWFKTVIVSEKRKILMTP